MKHNPSIPCILISASLLLPFSVYSQEGGQSGGGDSAAEASVTGSASQKAVTAPEALEGNPVVSFLKQGVSLQKVSAAGGKKALKVLVENATSFAEFSNLSSQAKTNLLNLAETVSLVNDAKAKGVSTSLTAVATRAINIKKLEDSGLTGKAFTDALTSLRDTSASVGENVATTLITLADDPTFDPETFDSATLDKIISGDVEVKPDDTTGGSFSVEKATFVANVINKASAASLTVADADAQAAYDKYKTSYTSLSDSEKDSFESKVANSLGKLVGITTTNDDGTISNAITITSLLNYAPDELEGIANIIDTDARHDVFLTFAELYDLQDGAVNTELITEITGAANLLNAAFVDRTISGDNDLTDLLESDTLISYNAAELAGSGITKKAASIAEGLGLFGKNGTNLLAALPESLTVSNITEFNKYLLSYTGSRDLGDNDLKRYEIPLGNLNVLPGKNIKLEGDLDVSTELAKAVLTNNNVEPSDIKLLALASGKDFTITGDLTIKNTNEVEDHGLALVAADDFYLRSEYSSANSADYSTETTTPISVEYTGSNLAIASVDSMYLVNVNIKTGGNLAIGTLSDLKIVGGNETNEKNYRSSITAGTGGNTPSPDLVLLYANELLHLSNLDFIGDGIREIHLDAMKARIENTTFASGQIVHGNLNKGSSTNISKVTHPSGKPLITFENTNLHFVEPKVLSDGDLYLNNVSHADINNGAPLTSNDFIITPNSGS